MSYHQGSVWPLFTGWGALAEYRANQPLPAQQMLMQNVDLTWAQDPGAVTELLSGDFYVPMGRSTSHQLWSSAMVFTPTLRGLFGINLDAATNTITVNPHLPANWDVAHVYQVHLGEQPVNLQLSREKGRLRITAQSLDGHAVRSSDPSQERYSRNDGIRCGRNLRSSTSSGSSHQGPRATHSRRPSPADQNPLHRIRRPYPDSESSRPRWN